MQLVLASTSPRRRDLLSLLGVTFEVCAPNFEERPVPHQSPREQVEYFAREKARSVSELHPDSVVLGSDTVIEHDGCLLGKPRDLDEARWMLERLAGRTHQVHTAVAVCRSGGSARLSEIATATVVMKPDRGGALAAYLATGESLGKAGAYSIQGHGAALIEYIDGDFTTVVGLPLRVTARLLRAAGVSVPGDVDRLYREMPYPNWSRFSVDCQKGDGSPRMRT